MIETRLDKNFKIKGFFDEETSTISYVVYDMTSKKCAVIDSVLDFDFSSGTIDYHNAEKIISFIEKMKLDLEWLIETHVHADHLSASPYIQKKLGGKIGISEKISDIQNIFGKTFNAGTEFQRDGSQFDRLFKDNDEYKIGNINCKVINTPGHTPACTAHVIGNSIFVGDTLFMPDFGTARCDFPGGSSENLFSSIQKILSLPDATRIFVGHDYKAPGREHYAWETTVGEQKKKNIHIKSGKSKEDFVKLRDERDAKLAMPKLIVPSLQINMRAGNMPEPDEQGDVFLKVPINKM